MAAPKCIGKYEILEEIGRGGFAVVYRAHDPSLDRVLALKVLHPYWSDDPTFAMRFRREARAAANLRHPNIVTVYEAGEAAGQLYIAMEYLPGRTLRALLEAEGALSLERALPILEQMADALDYAHGRGVVHRDVKPANVMVEETEHGVHATLMDFGLVKAMEGSAALTSQGTLLGSPEYMAPEQADPDRAAEIGPATDRYALGILAYEMLTGRVPFPGNTPGTLNAHEHKPVPPPRSLRPDMSEPVEAALLKMLAKAPSERFTCARDFTARLREALMTASQLSRREAQLAPLYARLQQAAADKDWTEVLALGGQIAAQDAPYRDVPAWMEQARAQLRRPPPEPKPEREPRKPLPLWVWGILGAVMFIACGVGLATVVPALLPTATPTRRTPTVTVMTVIPRISTVTPTSTATSSPTSATTPVATHTPITGTTTTRTVDGMVMVYVPAGEFLMGNDQGGADDEKPQREVYLNAFWIDRTEVTNAQYKECVQANLACKASSYAIDSRFNGDNQPVVGVDWNDAKTYCEWVGGALPTEAQWEKAARGTDGRAYPWGNNPITGKLLNFCDKNCEYNWKDSTVDDGYAKTAPVGSYLAGASPYGAWDMAGNVWEWVADWYDAKYYAGSPSKNPTGPSSGSSRVLRGGSWYCNAAFVRAAFRSLVDPGVHHGNLGFRCVGAGPGE